MRLETGSEAGAIFKNITTDDIREMRIPCAPVPVQKQFLKVFSKVQATQAKLQSQSDGSQNLQANLAQYAFSGRL